MHTHLSTEVIQRVRSHGAQIDRFAFQIADRFVDAFFASSPHLRTPVSRFPGNAEFQRRRVAHRWAWFVRHLGELPRVTPEIEALDRYLSSRGFTHADFAAAKAALIEALRDQSGSGWNSQLESDWCAAFDACQACFGSASRLRLEPQPGYALAA